MSYDSKDTPRVYVACIGAYNAGQLHGTWIYLERGATENDFWDQIHEMLEASPVEGAEEWRVDDYESVPREVAEALPRDWELYAELLEETYAPASAVNAWFDFCDGGYYEPGEWLMHFEGAYAGTFDSEEDWAREFVRDMGYLRDAHQHAPIARYFDYAAYARDAELGGDLSFIRTDEGVNVFWNH